MTNRDIITKIIYKNSTDTSDGLLIKFKNIEIIIDELDNLNKKINLNDKII